MQPRTNTRPSARSIRTIRRTVLATLCVAALAACGSTADSSSGDIASLGTDESAAASNDTGESTPDTSTSDSIDPADAFVAYTECMRDEGIDLPDAQIVSSDGGATQGGVIAIGSAEPGSENGPQSDLPDFDSEEYEAANDLCQPILDDAMGEIEIDPEVQAEQREQMLAHAQCMRDQGIDFPDPVFSDNGSVTMTVGDDEGGPMSDAESEEMNAAFEACNDLMGGGMVVAAPAGG